MLPKSVVAAWLTITAFAFGYWVSIMVQIYENSEVHSCDLGNWWPVFCLTHKHMCKYFHRFSQHMGKRLAAVHIISLLPSHEKQFNSVHLTLTWSLLLLHISTFLSDHTSLSHTRIRQKENKSQNVKIRDRWRHIFCVFVFVLPSTYLWPQKRQKQALADSSFYLTCPFQVALHSPLSKVLTSFWLPVALLTRSTQITHNALWCTNTWGQ